MWPSKLGSQHAEFMSVVSARHCIDRPEDGVRWKLALPRMSRGTSLFE